MPRIPLSRADAEALPTCGATWDIFALEEIVGRFGARTRKAPQQLRHQSHGRAVSHAINALRDQSFAFGPRLPAVPLARMLYVPVLFCAACGQSPQLSVLLVACLARGILAFQNYKLMIRRSSNLGFL